MWLVQYDKLGGDLQLFTLKCKQNKREAATEACLAALMPAVRVQELQLGVARPTARLTQLDASRLTLLHINVLDAHEHAASTTAEPLGHKAGLQAVRLTGSWEEADGSLVAAIAGMQRLTQLVLQHELPAAARSQLAQPAGGAAANRSGLQAAQLMIDMKPLQQLQRFALVFNPLQVKQ